MLAQTISNTGNVKLKFFSAYAVSVVLIVVIVLSVVRKVGESAPVENVNAGSTDENTFLTEVNTTLQPKLAAVNQVYLANAANLRVGEQKAAVQTAESEMQNALNDLKAKAANESNPQVQGKAQSLIAFFETAFKQQSQLYVYLAGKQPANPPAAATPQNGLEVQQLKAQLNQKDNEIATLQANLRKNSSVGQQPSNDDTKLWKEKAASLKAANDKLAKQVNTITASYQLVVEDNRRLFSRLEASKKQ